MAATAWAKPPGRSRWTLELLTGELVKLTEHASVSRETVRRRLAENHLKPWRKDMWCIPQVDSEYVARMEDVLDLYAEEPDPRHPVVCFDESPTQLIGEVRQPIPAKPRQIERYDYEYKRNGTANLFVFLDAHRPWRKVKVTSSRTTTDFADACESSPTFTFRQQTASASSSTISRRTRPAGYTRSSPRAKRAASYADWSSITCPSTQAG